MKRTFVIAVLGVWAVLCLGCGDDSSDKEETGGDDTGTGPEDTGEPDAGDTETEEPYIPVPTVAINENFDNWEPGGGENFYMAKPAYDEGPPYAFEDNATMTTLDGHDCLMIHDYVVDNDGYGFSAEFQLALDNPPVDMSHEDFFIQWDLYVSQEVMDMGANVQFGLYRTSDWTPIYSKWWSGSIVPDGWATIKGLITTTSGDITYSGFSADPDEWIFDVVRLQVIINGDNAAEGDEIWYCVDNVIVQNFEGEPEEDTEEDTPDAGE